MVNERALEEIAKGDLDGRVSYERLGSSITEIGLCLMGTGQFEEALDPYEQALDAKQQGDIHGRVDYESLRLDDARARALPFEHRRPPGGRVLVRARSEGAESEGMSTGEWTGLACLGVAGRRLLAAALEAQGAGEGMGEAGVQSSGTEQPRHNGLFHS